MTCESALKSLPTHLPDREEPMPEALLESRRPKKSTLFRKLTLYGGQVDATLEQTIGVHLQQDPFHLIDLPVDRLFYDFIDERFDLAAVLGFDNLH